MSEGVCIFCPEKCLGHVAHNLFSTEPDIFRRPVAASGEENDEKCRMPQEKYPSGIFRLVLRRLRTPAEARKLTRQPPLPGATSGDAGRP